MLTFKSFITEAIDNNEDESLPTTMKSHERFRVANWMAEHHPDYTHEHNVQTMLLGANDYIPMNNIPRNKRLIEAVQQSPDENRLIFHADTPQGRSGDAEAISVPKHMWEDGKPASERTPKKPKKDEDPNKKPRAPKAGAIGMKSRNIMRAAVYGAEPRAPHNVGSMSNVHQDILRQHFAKPIHEQLQNEREAIGRLHRAGHLDSMDTTDPGEKTDTVSVEKDEQGRNFIARSAKGVAGHALYTSGAGDKEEHHIINTCVNQTKACGGGVNNGLVDTSKADCFAPRAERQYPNAAIRRACHEQAKFDPAMTKDWILAHTHSLRRHAEAADQGSKWKPKTDEFTKSKDSPKRFLFRPNVLDETDRSSRIAVAGLNKQRQAAGKPTIIGNSYGKTNELHDPANGWHVTFSNTGPKVKPGVGSSSNQLQEVPDNITRDKQRRNQTITASTISHRGEQDTKNDQGQKVPPKNSYMLINAQRGSPLDRSFQGSVKHAKYWSKGRTPDELSPSELKQEKEGHFDGEGKSVTPDKAHYGHKTITREDGTSVRYDYQKQHVLHPRIVSVPDKKGKVHSIPTDSRFKDGEYLPKDSDRFKSPNGKIAGAILATTPVTSTPNELHHTEFTHHVDQETVRHATMHEGEWEIDKPEHQEAARGNQFKSLQAPHASGAEIQNGEPDKAKAVAQKPKATPMADRNSPEYEANRKAIMAKYT